MCGRFSLTTDEYLLNERFRLAGGIEPYVARYNCAPTQNLAVIVANEPRQLRYFRWGLIPFWAKDEKIGNKMINARAESITEKPSFKHAFKQRRCLIPADGFYEWKNQNGKTPFRIKLKNDQPFAMAGIWEAWKNPENSTIYSFSIITTAANELLQSIHERMPVILRQESEEIWLNSNKQDELLALLKPYDPNQMYAYEISKLVNSPSNDNPAVLLPV
ncbi:MAG: SOS response-associated peptidase [Bacteroidales bacterium]|jgi:putative SOS response-associated peptidase YedK|nr:SOS response-associated peptidase [Bacteroidales bacterium]